MSSDSQSSAMTKDALWYFLAKIIPAISTAYAIYLISQGIGTSGYGSYSTMIVVNLFLAQLFGGWLYQAVIVIGLRIKRFDLEFITSLNIIFMLSCVLAVLSAVSIFYYLDYSLVHAVCGAFLLASQMMIFFYQAQLQAYRLVKYFVFLIMLQFGVQTFLLVLIFSLNIMSFELVLLSVTASALLSAILYRRFSKRGLSRTSAKLVFKNFFRFVRVSWIYCFPVGIWLVFYNIYSFSDRVFMRGAGMEHELGMYSSSRDLILGAVSMISMPMLMALQPYLITTLKETKNLKIVGELIAEKMNLLLFFGVMLSGALASNLELLGLVINEHSSELGGWVVISCLSVFLGATSVYAHKGMELSGRSWVMSVVGGGVVLMVLCLNYFAASRSSLILFSLANFTGQFVYFGVLLYLSRGIMAIKLDSIILIQAAFIVLIMVLASKLVEVLGFSNPTALVAVKLLVSFTIMIISLFVIKKIRMMFFSLFHHLVR